MISQFISSTPDEVEATFEKTVKSWPITSSVSLDGGFSPVAAPIPSAATALAYAIDL